MANAIFGDGVVVTEASYSGPTNSKAIYSNGQLSPSVVPSTTGVNLTTDTFDTEINGLTNLLTLKMVVSPSDVNPIRISIANTLDSAYDSKLLIGADSVQTVLVVQNDQLRIVTNVQNVVFAESLATESFLPGSQTTICLDAPIVAKILSLFPQLDPETGADYSPAARRILRGFEAQVLLAHGRVA